MGLKGAFGCMKVEKSLWQARREREREALRKEIT